MIFEPGREQRLDIHTPTSAADVLPTLAHVTGKPIPAWTEGAVLPPFAEADPERSVFVVRAAKNDPAAPITRASTALVRANYKLLYFFGFPERGIDELVKLYDLEKDPEEMTDLPLAPGRDGALLAEPKPASGSTLPGARVSVRLADRE
jgi:arylsulfatase A-like enzyme